MDEKKYNVVLKYLKKEKYSFGETLRFIRKVQGLTVRKVASEVKKTATYISDIERGNNKPPEKKLMQDIISALDIQEIEIQSYLYDLAALERGGVSEDIVDYIMKNSDLRMVIRMAQKDGKGKEFWKECIKNI